MEKNIRPTSGYWICPKKHFNGIAFSRCAVCGTIRNAQPKDLSHYLKKDNDND